MCVCVRAFVSFRLFGGKSGRACINLFDYLYLRVASLYELPRMCVREREDCRTCFILYFKPKKISHFFGYFVENHFR